MNCASKARAIALFRNSHIPSSHTETEPQFCQHRRWIWFGGLGGESLGDEWRSARRQRFGANTPRSGKGWIVLDSRIDFCWTWSFTFSSNHSIIANGWTLSEQMAINLTGLIPLRYLSCVSAASATLRLTQHGTAVRSHIHTHKHIQRNPCKHWRHNTPSKLKLHT